MNFFMVYAVVGACLQAGRVGDAYTQSPGATPNNGVKPDEESTEAKDIFSTM